jgi:hypothetical protein
MSVNYGICVPEKTISKAIEFLEKNKIDVTPQNEKLHLFTMKYSDKEQLRLFAEFEKLLMDEFKQIKDKNSADDFSFKTFLVNGNDLLAEYEPSDEMTVFLQLMILMCKYIGISLNASKKYYLNIGSCANNNIGAIEELNFQRGNFNLDF